MRWPQLLALRSFMDPETTTQASWAAGAAATLIAIYKAATAGNSTRKVAAHGRDKAYEAIQAAKDAMVTAEDSVSDVAQIREEIREEFGLIREELKEVREHLSVVDKASTLAIEAGRRNETGIATLQAQLTQMTAMWSAHFAQIQGTLGQIQGRLETRRADNAIVAAAIAREQ